MQFNLHSDTINLCKEEAKNREKASRPAVGSMGSLKSLHKLLAFVALYCCCRPIVEQRDQLILSLHFYLAACMSRFVAQGDSLKLALAHH